MITSERVETVHRSLNRVYDLLNDFLTPGQSFPENKDEIVRAQDQVMVLQDLLRDLGEDMKSLPSND